MLRSIVVFLAAAILAGAPAASPSRGAEYRLAKPAARDAGAFRQAMLSAQNAARADLGEPPLEWSDSLADGAAAHAQHMAKTGVFAHADQSLGSGQGENLWAGTRDAYSYAEMVSHWVAERRDFVNASTPAFSRTGRWEDVGHYTQIVWRGTTKVGCAVATGGSEDYLVCRYYPAGNVMGQAAYWAANPEPSS